MWPPMLYQGRLPKSRFGTLQSRRGRFTHRRPGASANPHRCARSTRHCDFPGNSRATPPSKRAMEENLVLEARALGKRYSAVTAVRDVTFSIRPGEILGFLG